MGLLYADPRTVSIVVIGSRRPRARNLSSPLELVAQGHRLSASTLDQPDGLAIGRDGSPNERSAGGDFGVPHRVGLPGVEIALDLVGSRVLGVQPERLAQLVLCLVRVGAELELE